MFPSQPYKHKTRNRMRVAIQSVCVTKILALQRWSKIDFPPEFQTRQMHSFPIMYNTMGSKVDGLAVRDHFLPKNGLKTAILGEQIRYRLTSEGAGTSGGTLWRDNCQLIGLSLIVLARQAQKNRN